MLARRILCLLPLVGPVVFAGGAKADIVYREVFPNGEDPFSVGNVPLTTCGWRVYNYNGRERTDDADQLVTHHLGRPSDAMPIASFPLWSETSRGFCVNQSSDGPSGNRDFLMWTDEFNLDRSMFQLNAVRWFQGNELETVALRVALRIGNDWYASGASFTNGSDIYPDLFAMRGEEKVLQMATATWHPLIHAPFVIGGPPSDLYRLPDLVALPEGNLTAFGLYTDNKVLTVRFDTCTLEATPIPEPRTSALLCVALLIALWLRTRSRGLRSE